MDAYTAISIVCTRFLFLYAYAESHNDIPIRLRQFVKEKKFELRNFSEYGLENVLVVPRHKNNQVGYSQVYSYSYLTI